MVAVRWTLCWNGGGVAMLMMKHLQVNVGDMTRWMTFVLAEDDGRCCYDMTTKMKREQTSKGDDCTPGI
jgi:hypothetical protein